MFDYYFGNLEKNMLKAKSFILHVGEKKRGFLNSARVKNISQFYKANQRKVRIS